MRRSAARLQGRLALPWQRQPGGRAPASPDWGLEAPAAIILMWPCWRAPHYLGMCAVEGLGLGVQRTPARMQFGKSEQGCSNLVTVREVTILGTVLSARKECLQKVTDMRLIVCCCQLLRLSSILP